MRFVSIQFISGFVAVLFGCSSLAYATTFKESDIGRAGSFSLAHAARGSQASVLVTVTAPKEKDRTQPIGNVNSLVKLSITLNGTKLVVPKECQHKLLDINYIRLENTESLFRFWVQGGDGSEAYQVAFTFAPRQPVTCKFLPDATGSIEPMMSQKTLKLLSKSTKK
jgi:hypothetical protein